MEMAFAIIEVGLIVGLFIAAVSIPICIVIVIFAAIIDRAGKR